MNELTTTTARQAISWVIDGLTSPNTRRAYERHLIDFMNWHAAQGQPALSKAVVQAYKAHLQDLGKSTSVMNQALSAIRTMAREAADNGALDPTIAQAINNIKTISGETLPAGHHITPGELLAMLEACDGSNIGIRDGAMIALLYSTGMRRSELVALDLGDYDPEENQLKILKAKGNKQRTSYLAPGARSALDDWLSVRGNQPGPLFVQIFRSGHIRYNRLTTQAIWHVVKHRAGQAGIERPLTPHDFRRSFIGDLLDRGSDIVTVQKLVGHANPSTTARYDRRDETAKAKAVRELHVPYKKKVV